MALSRPIQRWCLPLLITLMVLLPAVGGAVARARAATGTITPGGPAVTITTTQSGESSDVTFAGVAGNRVYLKISGVSLNGGFEVVGLVSPANVELNHSGAVTSVGNIDTTVLPTTGAYKIHIDTYGGPGPTTLTLYDVPPDFTSSMSFGGPSVTVTTTVPGQDGRVSFTGYVNQPIRLRRSAISISTSIVQILKPDGTVLASSGAVGTPDNYFDATLPVDGTYTALVDGFKDATGNMTLSIADPEDNAGPVGADQTPAGGDDTVTNPATPQPTSPLGPVAPGSYTTDFWASDETGTTDGVNVISSTAVDTIAITGVVVDGTSAAPVPNATVTLSDRSTSATTTTTSDTQGGYAFINMPAGEYDLSVTSSGYGSYEVTDAQLAANDEYEQTAALLIDDQSFDTSGLTPTTQAYLPTTYSATDKYPSARRPPPTIRVALHGRLLPNGTSSYSCDQDTPSHPNPYLRTWAYPWRYYVLHTAYAEGGPGPWPGGTYFRPLAWTAIAAAVDSYAWYFKINRPQGLPDSAEIDNTTNFQCFIPAAPVPFSYRAVVGSALRSRIIDSGSGDILESFHLGQLVCSPSNCSTYSNVSCSGSYGFSDPTYPPSDYSAPLGTNGILSQLGAKAADEVCGVQNWRSIVNYYYRARSGTTHPGQEVDGTPANRPPPPIVSYLANTGQVTLNFVSKVGNTPVGWRYALERSYNGQPFRGFQTSTFTWSSRTIPTSSTFFATGCWRYRVRAWNPLGWSSYVYFSPTDICT